MSAWLLQDRRHRTFGAAAAAVLVASIFYALILKFGWFGASTVTAIDDLGEALAAAIASGACAWAATRSTGKERLAWALMAISTGLWSAGEVAWSVYEVFLKVTVPYPGLPDVGFLSAVPFAMAGIRTFWSEAARGTSVRWRVWFDGVIVAIALTATAWAFGLKEVWNSGSSTRLLDVAYPAGDILVGTMLILAIRRATRQQTGRMALLLAGIAAYSIADSAFAYLTAHGSYASVGSVLNTGWFAGFLMIALAATFPPAPQKAAVKQAPLDLWQLALPWMTLLLASAGDVYASVTGHDIDLFMSSLTAALAVLLTINMIVERREFLEMMNEIQTSHSTLDQDIRSGLTGIERDSQQMEEQAEKLPDEEVRRLAGEIHDNVEKLEHLVEEML
jgi:signal transduction histidine kinase